MGKDICAICGEPIKTQGYIYGKKSTKGKKYCAFHDIAGKTYLPKRFRYNEIHKIPN